MIDMMFLAACESSGGKRHQFAKRGKARLRKPARSLNERAGSNFALAC
jgi:hypothetical protein